MTDPRPTALDTPLHMCGRCANPPDGQAFCVCVEWCGHADCHAKQWGQVLSEHTVDDLRTTAITQHTNPQTRSILDPHTTDGDRLSQLIEHVMIAMQLRNDPTQLAVALTHTAAAALLWVERLNQQTPDVVDVEIVEEPS